MGSLAISTVGVILGVVFLMVFTYKGYNPMLLAVGAAAIMIFTSGLTLKEALLGSFMSSFGGTASSLFFVFMFGTMFAGVMTESGAAHSIAYFIADLGGSKFPAATVMIINAVLMIAGFSVGAYFVVFPIAVVLFSKANVSKNMMLACIGAGGWTWANMFPFAPSSHNILSMNWLGTQTTDAWLLGVGACAAILIINVVYLEWQARRWTKKGKAFDAQGDLPDKSESELRAGLPPVWRAFIPVALVFVCFNVVKMNIAFALVLGTVCGVILEFPKHTFGEWYAIAQKGYLNGLNALILMSVVGGIGGVIKLTPCFAAMMEYISSAQVNPYMLGFLGAAVGGFVVGGSTGGLSMLYPAVGPYFQSLGASGVVNMGALHRVCVMGACTIHCLPHNGNISALTELFGIEMKNSYFPMFITAVVVPFVVGAVCVGVATMVYL